MFSQTLLKTQIFKFFNTLWRRRASRITLFILAIPCFGYLVMTLMLLLTPLSQEDFRTGYPESRRILDRQGRLLREVVNADGARARWTELKHISPLVVDATVAVEDARFYSHSGVDIRAVVRAVCQNITAQRMVSGASTLTMQLSRLLYGHSHRIGGKIEQAFNALQIERAVDKNTILEQYLNRAPYGAGTIGIEAASQRYFGKPSLHLSLAEAALLAGLPKAPTDLNPLQNLKAAKQRQHFVLWRMLKTGKISREEFRRACRESIHVQSKPSQLAAMHFTDYGLSQSPPPGDIITTLDGDLQRQIEKLVTDHVQSLRSGGLTNAAVVVLDNRDGAILAMVGSADYWNPNGGSVNGVIARRQPGSALKPFTYALAFERDFTPASVVADIETQYLGSDGTLFIPRNYSERFYGPVLVKEALGRSLNVPAIRTLNAVGVDNLLKRLQEIGFASLDRDAKHYGLGLTLGNGEVTLLELAQGFAMFARGGLTCKAKAILYPSGHPQGTHKDEIQECKTLVLQRNLQFRPERLVDTPTPQLSASLRSADSKTKVLHSSIPTPQRAFSEEICFLITDILSDESLRIRAFGVANPLLLGFPQGTHKDEIQECKTLVLQRNLRFRPERLVDAPTPQLSASLRSADSKTKVLHSSISTPLISQGGNTPPYPPQGGIPTPDPSQADSGLTGTTPPYPPQGGIPTPDPSQEGNNGLKEPRRVFSEEICFLITDILSDESLRIRAFGVANPLLLGFPMAIKTGTSANWRDNWVVGYTWEYTIAVWAGDFEGTPMNQMSGAIGAGPLFHKIAKLVVSRGPVPHIPGRLEPPEGVEQIEVCALSGMTPTEHCSHRRSIYVLKEDKPRPPCNVHRSLRIDTRNGLLASNRCPSTFVENKIFEVLPSKYAEWQANHNLQRPPTRYSPYCPEKGITANALVVTTPRNGEVYLIEPGYDRYTQTLQLNGEVDPALPEVTWLVDGQKVVTVPWPYEANWAMAKGRHRIEMVGGGMQSDPIEFEVR